MGRSAGDLISYANLGGGKDELSSRIEEGLLPGGPQRLRVSPLLSTRVVLKRANLGGRNDDELVCRRSYIVCEFREARSRPGDF